MKNKKLKLPSAIIAVGLIAAVVVSLLTGMVREPAITQHDFPYSVTYTLNGETQTLEGIYSCQFRSTGMGTDPLNRYYEGTYLTSTSEYHPAAYTIAQEDGLELCIVTIFSDKYLMGDAKDEPEAAFLYDPYLAVMDEEGMEYSDAETLSQFDAELVSWQQPEPVENTFHFVGFSCLHDGSMIAMLVVGILVLIVCMIFVKRDKSIPYKALDKVSILLNFIMTLAVIPFTTVVAWLMQITVSGDEFGYQMFLCTPAVMAFTVAASIALRRKGFTRSGFFIQFAGPVLFALLILL